MKIAIIGGGPAGLYSAILLKKAAGREPRSPCTSANRAADDTFGFGVVFSDATLDNFEKIRSPELSPHHPGVCLLGMISPCTSAAPVHRVGGNGFCGLLAPQAAPDPAGRRGARAWRRLDIRGRHRG